MKEELEAREKNAGLAKRKRADELSEAERRQQEIEHLAGEGRRRRMEMQEQLERRKRKHHSWRSKEPDLLSRQQHPPL